ncbi:MAG: phage major capsid protein, partial [Luteimonas sp.]
ITADKPLFNYLIKSKEEWGGAGGYLTEPLRVKNDGNGQDYFGADQVNFNARDPIKRTRWPYYGYHQGYGFDEDTLQSAGIQISDDSQTVVATADEKYRLGNLYKEVIESMRLSTQVDLDERFHLNGAQSAKAAPGLDSLISLTPTVGTVGGLDAAQFDFWRNNTRLGIVTAPIADGPINAALKAMWRASMLYGGVTPDGIFCGLAFLEALEAENRVIQRIEVMSNGRQGTDLDGAIRNTTFNGVPVMWDPTHERLDAQYGPFSTPWTNRCYMHNSKTGMRLRPIKGAWMQHRKPKRMHDRYVHFCAMTSKYGMTIGQRNATAVLSIT